MTLILFCPSVTVEHQEQLHQKKLALTFIKVTPLLNCHILSTMIDVGDVIEYRLGNNDDSSCICQANITDIKLKLNRKPKTVLLNNRDKLINSLHMVHRILMQNLYTSKAMWNLVCDWCSLPSFHMHPTEDALDGPGDMVQVCDDSDVDANGNYFEGDPVMSDP